ncbi:hypothetical protein CVT24_008972 [Panaeolus cyanescens]|uniref:Major facilitator superfamily (MFS) profile domain-containing protein n=1 Tax=Panaeolus cyanescens TaxID=181874 RepID=A0A409YAQ0_9AGAR|nr:hypothetical protein CVT24_008972 [Panaeolus cyanescens]
MSKSGPKTIKLAVNGLPLLPQPTNLPFDPLNYPNWLKYLILLQASFLAFLATLTVAIINPAVVPLAEEFDIAHVTATYQTTVAIGTGALGPLFFTPFANVYGRRPAYLLSALIGFVSCLGSAIAKSFGVLVVARALNGFACSAALGLGVGTVVDLFYSHQRGKAMGFFTLMLTNGAHLAPIMGGYVAKAKGWRWCFWVAAILNGIILAFILLFMPETLFDRPKEDTSFDEQFTEEIVPEKSKEMSFSPYVPPPLSFRVYLQRLSFWDTHRPKTRRLHVTDFVLRPLSMLKYPSVLYPALCYGVIYGFASIEPALTLATLFTEIYHFDTVRNGLANGVTLLIGATLGELCSGPVTDAMMLQARKRALRDGKVVSPEIRLQGIWTGVVTVPVGLIMCVLRMSPLARASRIHFDANADVRNYPHDGLTIHFATTFIAPCIGMAVACFGMQIVTFFRQIFGLTLGFYSIPFGEKVGFEWSFTVFALICIISFVPIFLLMAYGERWRVASEEQEKNN